MAILQYNEATVGTFIIYEGQPYEVLESRVFRMQQRKPVNATKLRNLISGNVVQHSFGVSDKMEEADLETKPVKYLYTNKGEYWFCEEKDPSKRFKLEHEMLGDGIKFVKANSLVDALIFEDPNSDAEHASGQGKIIGIKLPIKVDLKVVEAPPAVKGDTVKGGSKQVKLETGATINAPLFINEGEVIRINTTTGDYVERA
ncbi:MAG: hypothetical protein A3C06_00555 [Candidatus Taylorbacteria bacterium RIFCSPHIGHO2_02_FULL_46_13]|uniref:Elongation factor P C-terminal domain-containing protein n=1 Tax=Candidatus Taylorbacteria bacterium RIFCSPHIGHO2_02_FULL_46_13 TaxID=1802312 RepID=A0A1G2MTV9_9BACT|nr:MAG: hypothetical protein A3C06_00555 [Candidatus Taylorbacteria bacterium RIFCSPHIGHO2_02_FULL_46_13]